MSKPGTLRSTSLDALIYDKGGVTKASVTLIFDNSDRDRCPIGFENCPQITVTRQVAAPATSSMPIVAMLWPAQA